MSFFSKDPIYTHSTLETKALGALVAKSFLQGTKETNRAVVLALEGELGSGKTTFVQGFAKALGIQENVLSPTFVIVREHGKLYHIDCYRLSSGEELKALGWDKMVSHPGSFVLVEWPENIRELLPPYTKTISFATLEGEERVISFR
ncbi:MAG TPA: tRNA (adenosine(37)-N6)-threonylcarbamoyltransferase complex ATPase subunit type 1 TsaE [Candidatus Paceibacterota bacterium]|nr:tRNA (adenosine(37)-N6)-threonylcarbamoyltransferase complex ATPase subunit type 1 TsaE [Candidatus Paceibacterota bacterium]